MKSKSLHIAYLLIFLTLFTHPAHSQLEAWGDTTICQGGSAQLFANGDGVSYFWSSYPTDPSLLIPQQQNPVVSPQVSTMYVVQSNIATGNLILNGSFELGVMGFNSEYVNNQVSIVAEGTYAVVNDAHTVHPNFYCNEDHTSGSGKFMAVNGAGVANVKVWYLSLNNIQPGSKYEFSTWITSLHATNPAILQFSINGELMGEPFQAYPYTCDWYQFFHIWEAGDNTQATISIVNQNTILSGNDFALDDISFATVLVYFDTVYVEVLPQFTSTFVAPQAACTREIVTVTYQGNAPDTAIFNWDFGDASVLSGNGPGPYEIVHNSIGNNTISLWVEGDGCASDTATAGVLVGESPVVAATADAPIIPYGSSTTLHGSYSGGTGPYAWSWEPAALLTDPGSLNPQTNALFATTGFILAVTDQAANCTGYDTVIIQVTGGPLGVNIAADPEAVCIGQQTTLTAIPYGGTENYSYSWSSSPPGFTSDLPEVTVQPATTTTYSVSVSDGLSEMTASVTITVHPNPQPDAGPDQLIPYGTNTTLSATASGGSGSYAYHWEPAALVSDPDIPVTQTQNLIIATVFTLTVTDLETGCVSNPDPITISIDGGPLAVVITSDKPKICRGEEAVLTAHASGGNQGNYIYSWSDNLGNSYPSLAQIKVSPEDTTVFHVSVDDGYNVNGYDFTLVVFPSAEFGWADGSDHVFACPNDSVLLQPVPRDPSWNFLWSNGATTPEIFVTVTGIGFSLQDYSLTTTTVDGCTFTDTILVSFDFSYCSGIEDEGETTVMISPNPASGAFKVSWKKTGEFEAIIVYNGLGKMISQKETGHINHVIFDHFKYSPGLYYVHLIGAKSSETRKVLLMP